MVRYLICTKCSDCLIKDAKPESGEHQRLISGTLHRQQPDPITVSSAASVTVIPVPHCVCDLCNAKLDVDKPAVAWSMWHHGMDIDQWESEFLSAPLKTLYSD